MSGRGGLYPGPGGEMLHGDGRPVGKPPSARPACANCGKPATCFGKYEDMPEGFACDDCCAHGNEDGWCKPIIK